MSTQLAAAGNLRNVPQVDAQSIVQQMEDKVFAPLRPLFQQQERLYGDVRRVLEENKELIEQAREMFSAPGRRVPVEGSPTWTQWLKANIACSDRYVRKILNGDKPESLPPADDTPDMKDLPVSQQHLLVNARKLMDQWQDKDDDFIVSALNGLWYSSKQARAAVQFVRAEKNPAPAPAPSSYEIACDEADAEDHFRNSPGEEWFPLRIKCNNKHAEPAKRTYQVIFGGMGALTVKQVRRLAEVLDAAKISCRPPISFLRALSEYEMNDGSFAPKTSGAVIRPRDFELCGLCRPEPEPTAPLSEEGGDPLYKSVYAMAEISAPRDATPVEIEALTRKAMPLLATKFAKLQAAEAENTAVKEQLHATPMYEERDGVQYMTAAYLDQDTKWVRTRRAQAGARRSYDSLAWETLARLTDPDLDGEPETA